MKRDEDQIHVTLDHWILKQYMICDKVRTYNKKIKTVIWLGVIDNSGEFKFESLAVIFLSQIDILISPYIHI